jgi:hypothetical protein
MKLIFDFPAGEPPSSHYNLLDFNVVSLDEAQHIHARRHSICRDGVHTVCTTNHAPRHIHYLQRSLAVDDEVACGIDESEGP